MLLATQDKSASPSTNAPSRPAAARGSGSGESNASMTAQTADRRRPISCRATRGAPVGPTSRLAHLPLWLMTTASKVPCPLPSPERRQPPAGTSAAMRDTHSGRRTSTSGSAPAGMAPTMYCASARMPPAAT